MKPVILSCRRFTMKKLPLLISVPHAGLLIPPEAEPYCILARDDIVVDGDEGAAVIYDIEGMVESWHTTNIARPIVDLNQAAGDRSQDGVVKTHTIWGARVFNQFPDDVLIAHLLEKYYYPYH